MSLDSNKRFQDRADATRKLMEILPIWPMQQEGWMVVAISTGAISIADKIAKSLSNATLELLFNEAIMAPNNRDCKVGMVSESEEIVIHQELVDSFNINLDYIYGEAHRRYEERILKYIYRYRKGETIISLHNKNVLLVDEGIESGLTMMASIKTAIAMKAKAIAIATPVMPLNLVPVFESVADEVYGFYKLANFVDTEFYYEELNEPAFEEVLNILNRNLKFRKDNK